MLQGEGKNAAGPEDKPSGVEGPNKGNAGNKSKSVFATSRRELSQPNYYRDEYTVI